MAYDSARRQIVLFGGREGATYKDDTWNWDGANWVNVCGSGTLCVGPPPMQLHVLAYDGARRKVVLFGGSDGAGHLDETWEWDGSGWVKVCGSGTGCGGPSARSQFAMTYDAARQRVVLFGGCTNATCSTMSDE